VLRRKKRKVCYTGKETLPLSRAEVRRRGEGIAFLCRGTSCPSGGDGGGMGLVKQRGRTEWRSLFGLS
jgi:hypothetical protein